MRLRHRLVPTVLGVIALSIGAGLSAHIRLINPGNGSLLHWMDPGHVGIVINSTGSDDILDHSHIPALEGAIRAWNASIGTTAHLIEDGSPGARARTDWPSDGVHLMWFDETNSSGYFPTGSGIVALSPVQFSGSGSITDADVLFNGSEFQFTTSGGTGQFDVEDVGTHELGHLLGLDHSGWAGATMYPYVDPTVILHRSLSQDDVCGMRDAYPNATFASITGTIRRANDSTVPGAYVVARGTDGRPFASTLARNNGDFTLAGLAAGMYTLYATPLDGPVTSGNISSGHSVQTTFSSTILSTVSVASGQAVSAGNLTVGADVVVSLGRNSDPLPVRCIAGAATNVTLHGVGLVPGSSLASSDATIAVAPLAWSTSQVSFRVTVPAGSAPGHSDLTVTTGTGDTSILPAALEITPPDPVVANTVPELLSIHGGTALTIHGSNFRTGARVVIGPYIYADGEAGGCTVADAGTITLTTAATSQGTYDVVVIDATGVEGRLSDALQFGSIPAIASVFPPAGAATGGTSVILRGSDFVSGLTVSIDGVIQSNVVVNDATRVTVVTDPGVPGGPYVLTVQNPAGEMASSAFSFSTDPDPAITSVSPSAGKSSGGQVVEIVGTNFTANSDVYFGTDATSGAGGTQASSVTFVDAGTLDVVAPAHAGGAVNVMVFDSATGQSAVIANAFTYQSSSKGGCAVGAMDLRAPAGEGLSGGVWALVVFALLLLRASRAGRGVVVRSS